jgi:hypothetical protein
MYYTTYPTHVHTDEPCKHDLRLCTHCGDVYCAKCQKEWRKSLTYELTTGSTFTYVSTTDTHTHD